MATTFNLKGGEKELDLLERANDYYQSAFVKYSHIKNDKGITEIILRHPPKEQGFSLPKKKELDVEDVIRQIENYHKENLKLGLDFSAPEKKQAFVSAYENYISEKKQNEIEKKLQELGEKANKGYNPYESYLALKETAEEKGLTVLLKNEKEFQMPNTTENVETSFYVEYYKDKKKLPVFSAIASGDGKTKTFREENIYDPNMENKGRGYLSNSPFSSDTKSIKEGLSFAIARANNQERVLRNIAEKSITDSNYLYTMNVVERDRLIDFVKNTPDLQGKPLTSQDYLAISDAFARESQRENKILETGMSNDQLSEKASEYYDLYQEKEKQELKEQNLKTYEIEKNGTIQGEVKAENKEEAFITVSERYGEENFRLIEKEPEIKEKNVPNREWVEEELAKLSILEEKHINNPFKETLDLIKNKIFPKEKPPRRSIEEFYASQNYDKITPQQLDNFIDKAIQVSSKTYRYMNELNDLLNQDEKENITLQNREEPFNAEEKKQLLTIINNDNRKIEVFNNLNDNLTQDFDSINKNQQNMDKQQELAENLLEKVKKDFTPNEQFLISEFARLRNYKPVDIDDEVMDLAMVYQKSENFIDNASISKETINKVNKFLDENVSEVKDKDKVLLSSFVNEMHNDIEFSNQMKEVYKQAEMTAWDTEEDLTINTKQQNMDNEINKEKINSFIDATVFVNKNETTQEHTERYTQKWNELNAEEKAYVKEKGADIAVSSIGEAYYEDTFMPREKENEIILDFNSKVEKLISQSQQTVKNMEAITPQENVKEILNEIQEKLNPKEKAFLELKMIEFIGSKHNLGMAEVGNHLTYEEIQNVNQYLSKLEEKYFNPIEDEDFGLVDENYNKLLSKVVYEMETNNAFMNDVNPIFLEVAQNIQKRKEQFNIIEHLNNQMKYLGFGDNHKEEIQKGIDSNDKSFQIKTTSDKALFGNKAEFAVNFNKSEKGGVFLNSFDAKLTTSKGEERSQNFRLNFTAKEAINLLEGRAVKTELLNKQGEKFNAFVKLNFAEEKNEFGNYKSKLFNENYGVDTGKIVDELKLKFDKPEYRENAIKSLEKGNIIKAKFEHEGKEIQGKAFLNVEYKTLNLYNDKMQRLNNNKPLQGLAQDNSHEKNNVREQSISRGI